MKTRSSKGPSENQCFRVFVDGAGAGPHGEGSGYAWIQQNTGKKRVKRVDGLTNNQAEYRGFIYGLLNLPRRARADFFSDSQLMVNQFNRLWAVNDPKLVQLLDRVRAIIRARRLKVSLAWVPREQNVAGRLL